jgi:hypothetical protein
MPYRDPLKRQANRRQYYEANKEALRKRKLISNKELANTVKTWLLEYLKEHPCVDCGETNPIVLEFDHVRDKEFSIGNAVRRRVSLVRVIAEVEKCKVRCANCHRAKTYRDAGRTHRG